jgi:hypothetical protein
MFVSLRCGVIVCLSSLLVLALPLDANSQPHKGRGFQGGGAPRIGGGGGGPRIGGGGGPRIGGAPMGGGARFSAPGGGAPRMMAPSFSRGGGAPRMMAPSFSRGAIGPRIGAPSFSRGGARFVVPGMTRGGVRVGPSFVRPGFARTIRGGSGRIYVGRALRGRGAARIYAGRGARSIRAGDIGRASRLGLRGGRAVAAERALRGGAGRPYVAARFGAPRTFAAAAPARHLAGRRFGRQYVAHAHARRHWRRLGFFGWAGPLYWPYAYNDIFYDVFWTPAYDDPFWYYGYPDIYYGGLFSPFEYDDLYQWAPPRTRVARTREATGSAAAGTGGRAPPVSDRVAQMCGDEAREITAWPIERIEQVVAPNAEQRGALDAFANAAVEAAQRIKAACPTTIAFTPPLRLAQMQERIEAMRQGVDLMLPPLEKFYGLLSDEQKARLNAIGGPGEARRGRSAAQACAEAAAGVTDWPAAEIERMVRPTAEQRAKLDALKDANVKAADSLKASCPTETPATPPARLAAVGKRLDALREAIQTVRGALDDFYASLNDEQKAQFNVIGRSQSARQ